MDREHEALECFEELAKYIEEEQPPFTHVHRGNGVLTITMGIPKERLMEPILSM